MISSEDKMFAALTPTGREMFQTRLVRKAFRGRCGVITKGDPVSGAFFVLDGTLRVYTVGANGREADLYRLVPGDTCVLALNALFNKMNYPAWVEAETDTLVGVLPGDAYQSLFSFDPFIQNLTIKALSSAVVGMMAAIEERTGLTVEQRLAGHLSIRSSSENEVRLTQQGLAVGIGTTREVVGRIMAQFAADGLVKSGRGVVTILDRQSLCRIAAGEREDPQGV